MAKQAGKVSLINVHDYPKTEYSAHWQIAVMGNADEGFLWKAEIVSNTPIGYRWKGVLTDAWPKGVQLPNDMYPRAPQVTQDQFVKLDSAQQSEVIRQQDAWRAQCAAIYEASPKPEYVISDSSGTTDTKDEADTAAQQYVLVEMAKYKYQPSAGALSCYAGVLPPINLLGGIVEDLKALFRPVFMALAYSTVVRNERLQRVQVNIDLGAGAGLLRIYDGSRPATCGTATTKLAELTFTDPCAPAAGSGVLTMSAITADSSADATGTATWFRCVDSTGTCCVDGNVGTSGSDMNLNSTSINSGVQVSISSFVITAGNP